MLKGKCALVTGGSRGIGAAIALKLAENGANIIINHYRSEKEADDLAEKCRSFGVKVETIDADVGNFDEAKNIIDFCITIMGKLDILVNNAGITKDALLLRMKEEDFDAVINTNLKGSFNCLRHAAPIMLKQKSGKIISISSIAGIIGNGGQVNYSASKAGIIGMTKSAAKELGSRGITVNAVAPGFIETAMTAVLSDEVKEQMKNATALKRFGQAEDIANLVAFLVSDEASYITGQVITIDGGMV